MYYYLLSANFKVYLNILLFSHYISLWKVVLILFQIFNSFFLDQYLVLYFSLVFSYSYLLQ